MSLELDDAGFRVQGKQLLDHVDLCLEPGRVVGVIGANGAGKTSLLKLASAELSPTSGEARLDRASLKTCTRESLARQIAVLPQHSMLDFPFRVDEVLHMGRIPHMTGQSVDAAIVDEVSKIMQLQAFAYRTYTTLSGGERQRVQIGRVLCQVWDVVQGAYLLFDEPTAPLDLAHQLTFLSLVKELAQKGAGILLILHDINLAARFADEIILLKEGRVLANGQPDAVLTADNIRAGFGVEVELVATGETRLIVASPTRRDIAEQANPVDNSG
ncbi:MAG: heme ABC transporter ATP-binding protein [Pseudomonadales bacterium]